MQSRMPPVQKQQNLIQQVWWPVNLHSSGGDIDLDGDGMKTIEVRACGQLLEVSTMADLVVFSFPPSRHRVQAEVVCKSWVASAKRWSTDGITSSLSVDGHLQCASTSHQTRSN